jgi:succinate dehydrogenase / fumarate reductase cytochrome b subunit
MTTIIRKYLMALTGLFLCLFLVIHLAGNLQLLLPPERSVLQFNEYSRILSGNLIIKAVSYILFASLLIHTVYAIILTLKNKKASGGKYMSDHRGSASRWYTRNMGILGSVILLFLIIHLKDFWYVYSFGSPGVDANGNKDLFTIVVTAYREPWYVGLNILAFLALGYHLLHGIESSFKSLGAYPSGLARFLRISGIVLSTILTAGFIIIPIYIYINY